MPNIELQLDRVTSFIYSKTVMFLLLAWNWLSTQFVFAKDVLEKSIHGALDAHKTQKWVFLQRNTAPWIVLEDDYNNDMNNIYPLVFVPTTCKFYFYNENAARDAVARSFNDVVSVELLGEEDELVVDASHMFHTVSWMGSSTVAPSLYEIVLIECLRNGIVLNENDYSALTLRVMTAEAKTYDIPLGAAGTKLPFSDWSMYPLAEAVAEAEDAEEAVVAEQEAEAVAEETVDEDTEEAVEEATAPAVEEATAPAVEEATAPAVEETPIA